MKLKNTYPKILLLILSSSIFFILLYFSLYYYTKQVEKQVYQNSELQFNNEVNRLLQMDNNPIQVAINNDTNWDEFVRFTQTADERWYNQTIGNELNIYKADYLGTYNIHKKFMIRVGSSRMKSADIIPKHAMDQLDEVGTTKFFMRIPEGIIEVTGASIHPSDDPLKKKTKPFGYFFVARLMDQKFVEHFEKIAQSEIRFLGANAQPNKEKHTIYAVVSLQDCYGQTIGKLLFERNFEVYFENMLNILYLIFIVFTINVLINLFYTRKLVYRPLSLITRVLETGNRKAIKQLKETHGEFRNIGLLFEENNHQKQELVQAKLKAEESDRLKSSFLANLSHEIRTPMNAISGFTDLLIHTQLSPEEQMEYLKVVDKSGRNLVSIIDDLIEMSKIDSNQIAPNYTQLDLEACISEIYETVRITIPKSKPVTLKVIPAPEPAAYPIVADDIKLKQVIINLITNGIKYTDQGTVSFGYVIDELQKQIVISVHDTGPGIDAQNQAFIFDRFKRIENDASIKAGGLGLGLAITKAYVEMMGGSISLSSKVGQGSVFSFTIPLQYAQVQKISVQPVKVGKSADHASFTILIAEDDNINYLLFQKIIQSRNYQIIRAVNGLEAVEICLNNPQLDLVLMDIKMPIMNGFEALEKVKAIRPELLVVAQTAYASSEDEERIRQAGFYAYLTKPIHREKLFEIIDEVQKNSQNDGH